MDKGWYEDRLSFVFEERNEVAEWLAMDRKKIHRREFCGFSNCKKVDIFCRIQKDNVLVV